ncbi:hypothetical protein ACNI5A_32870, partial [Klebsiella pneumoniae]|uniref:hypothetical protein n=1 Tax=Klebsiella pneumoniae TaxID=573 RepID=UPI003A8A0CB5
TLATAALPVQLDRNHQLRLESAGTLHHVYVDGRLVLDVDSGGPTHGNAALLTFQAAADYDNVVVSPSPRMTGYETDF